MTKDMPKFEVNVSCTFSMKVSIEAPDEASALVSAEQEVSSNYAVYGRDEEERYPFEALNSALASGKKDQGT